MSWEYLEWARKTRVGKSGPKFALIMLANAADEQGTCYPKVETLAEDMEAGVSTVHAHLGYLEKEGLIRVLVRYAKRGSRRSNRYQLLKQGAETGMPEYDDWVYERPDGDARKARGRTNLQDPEASSDQDVHASENGRDGGHASRIGRDMPPESGGTCLQDSEVTKKEDFNRQEEPPMGTARTQTPAPSGRAIESGAAVQQTIDGAGEDPSGQEPTPEQRAFGIARGWVDYREKVGKPIGANNALHSVKSLVLKFTKTGYTDDEIKRALNGLGRGLPGTGLMQDALDTIRDKQEPGRNGQPAQQRNGRGTGAMAGTNLFIADMSPEARAAQNPLNNAVLASECGDREGATV